MKIMEKEMSKELVPEIHDIGKLTNIKHNFEEYDLKGKGIRLETKTWQGILGHHCHKHFAIYPTTPDTFLLCIADSIAASVSRHIELKREKVFQVHKLWRGLEEGFVPIEEEKGILDLLKFIATNPTKDEYFQRYENQLRLRAEDSDPGKNITSLYTHSKLTGQFYKMLKKLSSLSEDGFVNKQREDVNKMIKDFQNRTVLTIAKCRFRFCQSPIRVRDLNIFKKIEELTTDIREKYSDNIFFGTPDELLLISSESDMIDVVCKMAFERCSRIEVSWATCNLDVLDELGPWAVSGFDEPKSESIAKKKKRIRPKREIRYPLLPESIEPPICEICQMAKATKRWPTDYVKDMAEEAEEHLCEICFSLRKEGTKLKKLERWTEEAEAKIIWVRLRLEFDQLIKALEELYLSYLRQFDPKISGAEIRFSVIGDFQEDYTRFLYEFRDSLTTKFGKENIEVIMDDFFCIKTEKMSKTLNILQIYNELLERFFPKLKEAIPSPLKFVAVCSSPKFPFFEVWRIIDGEIDDITISLIGHGDIRTDNLSLDQMVVFTDFSKIRKSALYKLAEVAKLSQRLAELTFEDRFDEDHDTYSMLKSRLPMRMSFQSILAFAQLIGD
jgi:hypothetical protein